MQDTLTVAWVIERHQDGTKNTAVTVTETHSGNAQAIYGPMSLDQAHALIEKRMAAIQREEEHTARHLKVVE